MQCLCFSITASQLPRTAEYICSPFLYTFNRLPAPDCFLYLFYPQNYLLGLPGYTCYRHPSLPFLILSPFSWTGLPCSPFGKLCPLPGRFCTVASCDPGSQPFQVDRMGDVTPIFERRKLRDWGTDHVSWEAPAQVSLCPIWCSFHSICMLHTSCCSRAFCTRGPGLDTISSLTLGPNFFKTISSYVKVEMIMSTLMGLWVLWN